MFPPARPESLQDARAHRTEDRRLNGRRTAQPTFAPSPSPGLWTDHVDHPFIPHQLASTHQNQPAHHDTTANMHSGIFSFSSHNTTPTMPFACITELGLQPSQHVPAADEPQRSESDTQPHRPRRKQRNSRHPQYTTEQWDDHRPKIKDLYIDQNASLEQTMETMSEQFDFRPSKKMYKDKFKTWGWSKYLPKDQAQWMLNKAEQRNRQDPNRKKDTIFGFGGQEWTVERVRKSTQRAKATEDEVIALDAPTPHDITYKTPQAVPPSPGNVRSPKGPSAPADRWTPAPSTSNPQLHFLQSTWNGHSLAEIEAIKHEAHQLNLEGKVHDAEKRFREALAGFENLLSPTHEYTNAVGYALAIFYAEHDRMDDADLVLNWMGQNHVERWGLDHQKTMTHFLHVAELFNSWSRNDDATTFLYRILDAWDKHISTGARDNPTLNPEPHRVAQPQVIPLQPTPRQSRPEDMTRAFAETDDPRRVDYQLGLANARVATNDETIEPLLLRLIEQCEKHPRKLASQILQARCALVDLYRRLGDDEQATSALWQAQKALETVLASTTTKTEPLLNSCIEVARLHIKDDYSEVAEDMLQRIGDKAEDTFGTDHNVTIEILVCIGKIYQRGNMWTYAQPWFERALAASMTANGLENAMTKRLEVALENQHYAVTAFTHEELESIPRFRMSRDVNEVDI